MHAALDTVTVGYRAAHPRSSLLLRLQHLRTPYPLRLEMDAQQAPASTTERYAASLQVIRQIAIDSLKQNHPPAMPADDFLFVRYLT